MREASKRWTQSNLEGGLNTMKDDGVIREWDRRGTGYTVTLADADTFVNLNRAEARELVRGYRLTKRVFEWERKSEGGRS